MRRAKIKNSTDWPDHFIRRMLAWCTATVEVPGGPVRLATFRKRTNGAYSGCAYPGRIVVSIGPINGQPANWSHTRAYKPADGSPDVLIADPLEALVAVTAHELGHIAHFRRGQYGLRDSEDRADARARYTLRLFRERRGELECEWATPPAAKPEKPKPSAVDQRQAAALAMMERWERKLKLAKTKVAKYRRRVAYYEKRAAAGR